MTKHTPTPWILSETTLNGESTKENIWLEHKGASIPVALLPKLGGKTYEALKVDAAFIVKAVNCHEDLLRVCKMIYDSENEQDQDKFAEPWMLELGEVIDKAEGK